MRIPTPSWGACVLALCTLTACAPREQLTPPASLISPYHERQVWAVAPFNNESGVSVVAGDQIADAFISEAEQIDGIDTIPVNRVIAAMRSLKMNAVTTPADARSLLRTLGVDGLIVGSVTAYDQYQPPKFGASVALFTGESVQARAIDPVQVTRARTDEVSPGAMPSSAPLAQVSGMFDANNHMTLLALSEYASGRSAPASAYGKRIFLVRMDLYTQFAAHRLLHDLLAGERARLLPENTAAHHTPRDD